MIQLKDNIVNAFSNVKFEEKEHRYTVNGGELTPATTFLKQFEQGFDSLTKSQEYAERHGGNAEEIAAEWKETGRIAAEQGTRVHLFGEKYFYDNTLEPTDGFEQSVVAFWKSLPDTIIPFMSESRLYSLKYKYAGTSDNLFFDKWQDGIIISDYKTNKNIFKNFKGQKLFYPFNDLLDTPYNKYQIQTSLYQIPLEDIGVKVVGRWIVWLKPDGTFEKYEAEDYTQRLREYLTY
jgi:hypothetical protein